MKSRRTTRADRFAAKPFSQIVGPKMRWTEKMVRDARWAHNTVRSAEKFVFDRAASERVGIVLRDIPELLVEQIQFARAPFDLCWIEYDSDVIFDVLNELDLKDVSDKQRDLYVGILIRHNRILVVVESSDGFIGVMPWAYHLNTEWPLEEQLEFSQRAGVSRLGIDSWLWGSIANKFRAQGKTDYLRVLRDTTMVEPLIPPVQPDKLANVLQQSNGDFKNHLAMILLLNQPSVTQYVRVPQSRGWIGNKPKPYMAYNNITMALDPVPKIIALGAGTGEEDLRRRHRVRGHYCHNDAAKQAAKHQSCIHEWQAADEEWELVGDNRMLSNDIDHWICAVCRGRRWWRAQHERGDASKGYVDHTRYDVRP
jgi:hypothetical protein